MTSRTKAFLTAFVICALIGSSASCGGSTNKREPELPQAQSTIPGDPASRSLQGRSEPVTAPSSPTLCVTYQMYVKDTPVPTTAGYDQMMAEKLSKIGYRSATCATAQILVSMAMRVTGDNEETGRVTVSIDGKNGSLKGHYDNTITAVDFHQNHEQVIQSMGLGLASVMTQIDPEYPKKVLQASGVQPNYNKSQKTICISYHFFMSDKELPLGDQFNHLLDKFFTDTGYRPTTCEEAQIKLTGDMHFTGDPPSKASILFRAKSAERSEQYSMEFTGDEWQNNRATIMTQMSLGMLIVMDKIEPGYLAQYGEWVQKQVQSPEK